MLRRFVAFVAFVVRRFPLVRLALLSLVALVVLEYACVSLLVPLGSLSVDAEASFAARAWTAVVLALGLPVSTLTWLWLFLLLLAVRTLVGFLHLLLTVYVAKQVHRRLTEATFDRVLFAEPIDRIYSRSIGYYITLAGDDAFRAGQIVNSSLQFLAAGTSALVTLYVLYSYSAGVFAAVMLFLGVVVVLLLDFVRRMVRLNNASALLSREAHTSFLEALNSLRSMRSMRAESFASGNYADTIARYVIVLFKIEGIRYGMRVVPGLIALLIAVVYLAPGQNAELQASSAFVLSTAMILLRVFAALSAMMASGGTLLLDMRASRDLTEFTQISAGGREVPGDACELTPSSPLRSIDLRSVHYGYVPGREIITGLDSSMHADSIYAIVGPSGSGKSTLADMLLGMIRPTKGDILINGLSAEPASLRERVVLVEQQPRVFSASLRDNLTLGLTRDTAQLEAALAVVGLLEFVRALPMGLDTPLDYQGANLSGGQRQRLAIARALLRHPQVLILDEATSALDPAMRDTVVTRIKAYMRGGVLVFITHDQTITALADHVLTLGPVHLEEAPLVKAEPA